MKDLDVERLKIFEASDARPGLFERVTEETADY